MGGDRAATARGTAGRGGKAASLAINSTPGSLACAVYCSKAAARISFVGGGGGMKSGNAAMGGAAGGTGGGG